MIFQDRSYPILTGWCPMLKMPREFRVYVLAAPGQISERGSMLGAMVIGDKYKQNLLRKRNPLTSFCGERLGLIVMVLWMDRFPALYKRFEDGRMSWPRNTEQAAELTEEQY